MCNNKADTQVLLQTHNCAANKIQHLSEESVVVILIVQPVVVLPLVQKGRKGCDLGEVALVTVRTGAQGLTDFGVEHVADLAFRCE